MARRPEGSAALDLLGEWARSGVEDRSGAHEIERDLATVCRAEEQVRKLLAGYARRCEYEWGGDCTEPDDVEV